MIYGVYASSAMVRWPPAKIFQDEIRVRVALYHLRASMIKHAHTQIIGSLAQKAAFPRALAYLDGGKLNVNGIVRLLFFKKNKAILVDIVSSR